MHAAMWSNNYTYIGPPYHRTKILRPARRAAAAAIDRYLLPATDTHTHTPV